MLHIQPTTGTNSTNPQSVYNPTADIQSNLCTLLCNLSALVAGFSTVFLAQVNIPDVTLIIGGTVILTIYAVIAVCIICLNLICLTITTCILLIQHQQTHNRAVEKMKIYELNNIQYNTLHSSNIDTTSYNTSDITTSILRYSGDIDLAYQCFLISIPLFLCDITMLSYIQFHSSHVAPYIITGIAGIATIYTCMYVLPKYHKVYKLQ